MVALIGVGILLFDSAVKYVLPVLIIVAGGFVLIRQFRYGGRELKDVLDPKMNV